MRIAILSHNLTSNAAMRAHRLGLAARHFAEVRVFGQLKHRGAWAALPQEDWIQPIEAKNLPKFYKSALELIAAAEADVIIAVKPFLASYGVALLAGECRNVPVILDIDVYREGGFPVSTDQLWPMFEPLRKLKNQFFFQSLTQKTLDLFA